MAQDSKLSEELLHFLEKQLDDLTWVDPDEIPNIDLYMDQVTTFMEDHLGALRRTENEKILTKTMINNYAKNRLLPPPKRKKYSKDHLILLLFIYYYKGVLSLQDIQTLLGPLTERYFPSDNPKSDSKSSARSDPKSSDPAASAAQPKREISEIYRTILSLEQDEIQSLKEKAAEIEEKASAAFPDAEGEEKDFLLLFTTINLFAFDTFLMKQMMERLLDHYSDHSQDKK